MSRQPRKYVYVLVRTCDNHPSTVFMTRTEAQRFAGYFMKRGSGRVVRYERSEPKARTR